MPQEGGLFPTCKVEFGGRRDGGISGIGNKFRVGLRGRELLGMRPAMSVGAEAGGKLGRFAGLL